MGFESYRIDFRGGNSTYQQVIEAVDGLPHSARANDSVPTRGSTYHVVRDGQHVIELESIPSPLRVSIRFTLCHPATVDAAFLNLCRELMANLGMEATVLDDDRTEQARSYSLEEFPEFAEVTSRCIAARRAEWVAAFGDEPLAATTPEVFQRVILPRCQPVVAEPT